MSESTLATLAGGCFWCLESYFSKFRLQINEIEFCQKYFVKFLTIMSLHSSWKGMRLF